MMSQTTHMASFGPVFVVAGFHTAQETSWTSLGPRLETHTRLESGPSW